MSTLTRNVWSASGCSCRCQCTGRLRLAGGGSLRFKFPSLPGPRMMVGPAAGTEKLRNTPASTIMMPIIKVQVPRHWQGRCKGKGEHSLPRLSVSQLCASEELFRWCRACHDAHNP
eukprot:1727724-Rhodomonas_salina.1